MSISSSRRLTDAPASDDDAADKNSVRRVGNASAMKDGKARYPWGTQRPGKYSIALVTRRLRLLRERERVIGRIRAELAEAEKKFDDAERDLVEDERVLRDYLAKPKGPRERLPTAKSVLRTRALAKFSPSEIDVIADVLLGIHGRRVNGQDVPAPAPAKRGPKPKPKSAVAHPKAFTAGSANLPK